MGNSLPSIIIVIIIIINQFVYTIYGNINDDQFQTVEFGSRAYGTELILLENSYREPRSYKFEDFFWTGSGDGSIEDDDSIWSTPTTIYKTKTITSTIYRENDSTSFNETIPETTTKCSFNCESPTVPVDDIHPTRTLPPDDHHDDDDDDNDIFDADRQFWLLTVLKSKGKDPVIIDLKNSLAKLYKTAFQRQQERHLGIITRKKRDTIKANKDKSVKVYIRNITKIPNDGENSNNIQVLYHVAVSGKPVDAVTAAQDMALVSDDEVTNELGYPFIIKAEPYFKEAQTQTQSQTQSNNTWIVIGVSIATLLVVLLLVALLTLTLAKKKRPQPLTGLENRQQIFERSVGRSGLSQGGGKDHPDSPTYINYGNAPSNLSDLSTKRPPSSYSASSSSSTSLDISPLMGVGKHRIPPKKPPRPKAAINKTAPLQLKTINPNFFSSESSGSSRRNSPDTIFMENNDPGVISPKSYLSMPSVKSFPRGSIPEPLNKVLEPVSVHHLDMPDDDVEEYRRNPFMRYGSVGAVEDPGVIGPVVWNIHQQKLRHATSVDGGMSDIKGSNVSKMRKRFHDLLDDTFSLFGSRKTSPTGDRRPPPIEVKSHSAVDKRPEDEMYPQVPPRPRTSEPRQVGQSPGSNGPKGAWESISPSPLIRPSTADLTKAKPKINVDHVLAEGRFRTNDPAVPLIAAIKSEIEKCSLPGSTTDVRK